MKNNKDLIRGKRSKIKGIIDDYSGLTKKIDATTYVTEEKYVNEIKESLKTQISEEAKQRNEYAVKLLRKARRGNI